MVNQENSATQYRTLHFVYHTDATPTAIVAEFVRCHFQDDAYKCTLCHLTYKALRKEPAWVDFTNGLPIKSTYHLRNRFIRKHPDLADRDYAAVFIEDTSGTLHDFLTAEELRACKTLDELIDAVRDRLNSVLGSSRRTTS